MQGELRVSGFSSLLVFGVLKKLSGGSVTAAKPFSRRGRAVATKERDVVREMKEKERERRALLRYVGWPVSFLRNFDVRHGALVEKACPFLLCHFVAWVVLR